MEKQKKKKVLFLCTGNSARSQMAEGLMRHLRGSEFEVFSAGTEPKGIHSLAIEAMKEISIAISNQRSKHMNEYGETSFDYIVTLCDSAATICPVFSGEGKRIHHSFSDPAAATGSEDEKLDMFKKVRDEIKQFLLSFPL
jgi:arsenate reductase